MADPPLIPLFDIRLGDEHVKAVAATLRSGWLTMGPRTEELEAAFAEQLKKTPDGDGTLLDHSLILYGSNMGNSNQHQHYDVGHTLVGGANGKLKGGRFLNYPTKTVTTGNLLVSVLQMFGIESEKQGDSTGLLSKL